MNIFIPAIFAIMASQMTGFVMAQSSVSQEPADTAANAEKSSFKYTLMLSPYTYHFNPKPTHKNVVLIGIEREHANAKIDGVAIFSNSFGQPSIYVYPVGGVYKSIWGVNKLSFKWTAGIIYGYRAEFKSEVANVGGFAPVVVPAISYEIMPGWSLQLNTLGLSAAQFQLNIALK